MISGQLHCHSERSAAESKNLLLERCLCVKKYPLCNSNTSSSSTKKTCSFGQVIEALKHLFLNSLQQAEPNIKSRHTNVGFYDTLFFLFHTHFGIYLSTDRNTRCVLLIDRAVRSTTLIYLYM